MNGMEKRSWSFCVNSSPLCGIDEAGRGPLAGSLVMAGVILKNPVEGLMDSKKLTEKGFLLTVSLDLPPNLVIRKIIRLLIRLVNGRLPAYVREGSNGLGTLFSVGGGGISGGCVSCWWL